MVTTQVLGIFQSDLIIRTAIVAGLHELRVKPYLIDYCFASLPKDELTAKEYGEKDVAAAKSWFLRTEIPVVYGKRIGEASFPCITVALMKSSEDKNTLSDTNYEVREDKLEGWPDILPPFAPAQYDRVSGLLTLSNTDAAKIVPAKGQVVVTRNGERFSISEVVDNKSFYIDADIHAELNGASIKGMYPPKVVTMGSAKFRESYALGAHVTSEGVFLTYLHSLLTFVLLRRRKDLLEARGYECSSLDSDQVEIGRYFEGSTETIHSRFIRIDGQVFQWWPETEEERAYQAETQIRLSGGGHMESDTTNKPVVGDEDEELIEDGEMINFD